MLRDKLLARLEQMGDHPDHRRLAEEVLGIRGAPEALARRLVSQALVLEDRRELWQQTGERICRDAPAASGVYILRDEGGRALYVGKAVDLKRRLRAHFAGRRWRATKPLLARAVEAEWQLVGSELEALLREAVLIGELDPIVNVQTAPPALSTRNLPGILVRDVIVLLPSIEADSVELAAARVDGGWMLQRTRRSGADLHVHTSRLWRLFSPRNRRPAPASSRLAPIVFSWLAGRGAAATRLDPGDAVSARDLQARLAALLSDEQLFGERIVIRR
jgi:predicted GIY-YIG superfamily endonuclease